MEKTVRFVDADNKLVTIEIRDNDGYFSMSGERDGSFGQVVDNIVPATDAQKKLVEIWNKYHLSHEVPAELGEVLAELEKENESKETGDFDVNEDDPEMFDAISDALDCSEMQAKSFVALARELGLTLNDIIDGGELNGDTISIKGVEFYSLPYDDAYEAAVNDSMNLFDDIGLEAVSESARDYILSNFCDYDWESQVHEDNLSYARDISEESSDTYDNRLIEEAIERGVISEEDSEDVDMDTLIEDFADDMDNDYNSLGDYFESIYGSRWTSEARDILEPYINWRSAAEYCVDEDGIANSLARYDGIEREQEVDGETFYLYKC